MKSCISPLSTYCGPVEVGAPLPAGLLQHVRCQGSDLQDSEVGCKARGDTSTMLRMEQLQPHLLRAQASSTSLRYAGSSCFRPGGLTACKEQKGHRQVTAPSGRRTAAGLPALRRRCCWGSASAVPLGVLPGVSDGAPVAARRGQWVPATPSALYHRLKSQHQRSESRGTSDCLSACILCLGHKIHVFTARQTSPKCKIWCSFYGQTILQELPLVNDSAKPEGVRSDMEH